MNLRNILTGKAIPATAQGNADKVTTRLSKYYSELEELRMPKTEANKLRHLRGQINMGGAVKEPYYISVWQSAVDDAILEHMSKGTEIDYAHWTTHLINDEAIFKKNTRNDSARISSAATGGRDYKGGSSKSGLGALSYNKSTGEPLDWRINGVNITLYYGNVDKMNAEDRVLPKVTKDWFNSNSTKKCPQKFKDTAKAITSSSSYKKTQKKRQRKIAASAAARNGGDDAELCSSSPN